MQFRNKTAVLLLLVLAAVAHQAVVAHPTKAIEDLDLTTMPRDIELGREASVYHHQPAVAPVNFNFDELPSEPVVFPRALNVNPSGHLLVQIEGGEPHIFDATPSHPAGTLNLELPSEPVTFDRRMEHSPQNFDIRMEHRPVNHDIRVVIQPQTWDMEELELVAQPRAFNRPLEYAPARFYNRPINGTEPRFNNGIGRLPFGQPRTMNIVPVDDEEEGTGATEEQMIVTTPVAPGLSSTTEEGAWTPYQ